MICKQKFKTEDDYIDSYSCTLHNWTYHLFSQWTSGYRPNYATTTALMKMTNDFLHWPRQINRAICIDQSKAFDLVNRDILLQMLNDIGLAQMALSWFSAYLNDRTQCVFVGSVKLIMICVPQGSGLGPLIFFIPIAELPLTSKNSQNIKLYSDDTVIYVASCNN